MFRHVCRMGLEGIVSKRTDAPYRSGPSKTWLKSKNPASAAGGRGRVVLVPPGGISSAGIIRCRIGFQPCCIPAPLLKRRVKRDDAKRNYRLMP